MVLDDHRPGAAGPDVCVADRRRSELGKFLKARRAELTPEDFGLPAGSRRRTPGLRREELAQLAGIGVTWYTWLEQGREINASTQVLDALARTLRLDRAAREHLYRLAEASPLLVGTGPCPIPAEVREIVDTCDFFLGEGRRLYGQTVPSEMPDKQLLTFRNPVGVVAVITAGNFPVAVPSWYLIPALLCGNCVVWKPAEYAAASAHALFELLVRGGGLPDGVLNLVLADGDQTFAGLELALDEGGVDKVGFTGSSKVGARIGELTGRHLQSACLENFDSHVHGTNDAADYAGSDIVVITSGLPRQPAGRGPDPGR